MKLELYASQLFLEYCNNQGVNALWDYLSDSRKLVWIEEALHLMLSSIKQVKATLKPMSKNTGQASFEMGYYQGMAVERQALLNNLAELEKSLKYQFEELKQQYNK